MALAQTVCWGQQKNVPGATSSPLPTSNRAKDKFSFLKSQEHYSPSHHVILTELLWVSNRLEVRFSDISR